MAAQESTIINPKAAGSTTVNLPTATVYCLVAIASTLFFFRHLIVYKFGRISGDIGDSRIVIALLEHWCNAFRGSAPWQSAFFFYPVRGTLGYTDAYFLYSLPYMALRAVGVDAFLSYELTLAATKLVGFFSMAWLLRTCFRLGHMLTLVGAVIFTLSNGTYVTINHAQLLMVGFVPLLIALLWQAVNQRKTAPRRSLVFAACAGVLLPVVLLTGFYIGWFFILSGFVAAFLAAAMAVRHQGVAATIRGLGRFLAEEWRAFGVVLVAFSLSILPFVVLYLPKLRETKGHDFSELVAQSGNIFDIVNVGTGNLLWGKAVAWFFPLVYSVIPMPGEVVTGLTPLLFLTFLAAVAAAVKGRPSGPEAFPGVSRERVAAVFGLTAVILWLMAARIDGVSAWWFVYAYFPGGTAMRIPGRLPVYLAALIIPVVMVGLDRLIHRMPGWRSALPVLLGALFVVEQVNLGTIAGIDRHREVALLDRVGPPPAECRSFFVAGLAERPPSWAALDELYAPQVDAMLLAERWRLPTVNGVSTWFPPQWGFYKPASADYLPAVKAWVDLHGIGQGLCRLDLAKGTWSPAVAGDF